MKFFAYIRHLFTRGEKTTIEKQVRAGIVLIAVALVGVIVYFAFVAPLKAETENYVPELLDGEAIYNGNTILMMPMVSRTQIMSVWIDNKKDSFTLVAQMPGKAGTPFYIEGYDDLILDTNAVAECVTYAGMLVTNSPKPGTQDRVNERATSDDLSNYGLAPEQTPSAVTVNLIDGTSYTVLIGDRNPTGTGYYAMIAGRVNTVTDENGTADYLVIYSLTNNISSVLAERGGEGCVTSMLLPVFSSSLTDMPDFRLYRLIDGENTLILQTHKNAESSSSIASGSTFKLDYPAGYLLNEDEFQNKVLTNLLSMSADDIVAYGDKVHYPEVYSLYGLDLDAERLAAGTEKCRSKVVFDFTNNGDGSFESGIYTLYFGDAVYDALGNGQYYVYSPYTDTIGLVSANAYDFTTWTSANFISAHVFYDYITSIDTLELKKGDSGVRYDLSGRYDSYHVDVTDTATGKPYMRDGKPLTFDVEAKLVTYGNYQQVQYTGEFENFRDLFYVLITRELAVDKDAVNLTVSDDPAMSVEILTTSRDQNNVFYKYDASGNLVTDANGRNIQLRYDGGYIECHNVKSYVTISGEQRTVEYKTAYYDEQTGKFFLKEEDPNDGEFKPKNYRLSENNELIGWTYLSTNTEATYTSTRTHYDIYYIYYDGTDRINQTFMYIVPTTTKYTYHIATDGTVTLADEVTTVSDGMMIRYAQIEKLFSDSDKVLAGKAIDKFGLN